MALSLFELGFQLGVAIFRLNKFEKMKMEGKNGGNHVVFLKKFP